MGIKNIKSFTLVELTVSIGILGMIIALTGGVLVSVVKSYERQKVVSEIERNGDFVLRTLEESLREADSLRCIARDGTVLANDCLLADGSLLDVGSINVHTYIGVANAGGFGCPADAATNCFVYKVATLADIESVSTPSAEFISDSAITNSAANGANIDNFDIIISGGGATGVPINITVTMDVKGPLESSWASEVRSFQSFLTVRGTYR